MPLKSFAITMALFLAAVVPASAVTAASVEKAATKAFADPIKTYDIPGLVVGITVAGKHYVYSDGVASRESDAAVDADTIFELGSVSKTFSATLAAMAADQGLLSLSAPTSEFLPQLKGSAFDGITLENLATHTNGGIPLQPQRFCHRGGRIAAHDPLAVLGKCRRRFGYA